MNCIVGHLVLTIQNHQIFHRAVTSMASVQSEVRQCRATVLNINSVIPGIFSVEGVPVYWRIELRWKLLYRSIWLDMFVTIHGNEERRN
ncbi:hypothetical protein RchiOBHm_Chr6g0288721 [Rosa chinensis]|uniref:Uncharacterized protein n=1 Tax=Rosa chinensis TaxID=74649 RepID=A0A2P6PVD7_ROSCH|nr:hypothetical protein RchiOBHm_Chr6g0288721 [Rosa chinensis]